MIYKSVSIHNVIAKILRDTRLHDSSYVPDLIEWIPEAMRLMQTNYELQPAVCTIKISDNRGKMPCGLIYLEAVTYLGRRLASYSGISVKNGMRQVQYAPDAFVTAFKMNEEAVGPAVDASLIPASSANAWTDHGYQIRMDYIYTTFETGEITVYFLKPPTDDQGLPLIPDQQDYKEAVYWYVRAKLIQAGYKDRAYGNDDRLAWERFELHASRAMSDISYPTVDQKQAQLEMQVRFIPPVDYWESMFSNPGAERKFMDY